MSVWDSLGDGYRANRQIDEAITGYRKAIEMDPSFDASRRNLAEVQQERQSEPAAEASLLSQDE